MNSRSDMLQRTGLLVAIFSHSSPTAEQLNIYIRLFSDVPLEILDAAIEQGMRTWKFFPAPAEIFEKINEVSPISVGPDSGDAWGMVIKEIHRTGFYGVPKFDSPLVARAVEIMNWRELCTSENQIADRAHFMKIYGQLLDRAESESRLAPAARLLQKKPVAALNPVITEVHQLAEGMEM